MLTGHIIPDLSIASLFGIRVLTEVGCEVTFTTTECIVRYRGKVILRGAKDPATDLWTLPLGSAGVISPLLQAKFPSPTMPTANVHTRASHDIATFAHTVRTKANSIRFAHQLLCSPTIPTFLKALKRGYLKGCPNLTTHGVLKYLNPSPATIKGHMKRPRHGIRSTRRRTNAPQPSVTIHYK